MEKWIPDLRKLSSLAITTYVLVDEFRKMPRERTIQLDYVIIIEVKSLPMYRSNRTSQGPRYSAAIVLFGRFAWGTNFKF